MAQQEGKIILQRNSNVDFVFGTDNLFELPFMLRKIHKGEKITKTKRYDRQKVRNFVPEYTFQNLKHSGVRAHLTITKGCNNYCSFCVVPVTRGLEVSREPDQIIAEAEHLVSTGTREICLLGQNVNSYKANGVDYEELLQRMDEIDGMQRLRFTLSLIQI